ncbi:class I SAM-dependent methyltransferase [Georgenia sp. 311]|uniref:Class I SAM-dependent methyltransferase n=1 Tax=Georgenia wutianyii TaxID=2585135 RepID=A0ABX5VMT3_9MICO|nr:MULTISPECIES: class I SAM-dependent methyltransferase [Georgenia]QDB79518.1 class I SAM-dependent methyltransferase [Georgenia wutianyii]TNC20521.1 class I SAM-dependent methyltransferase [Georgenia sp. 311]
MEDRHELAVGLVAAREPAAVLEVGCGPGATMARLAGRLPRARFVGIDRSATAIARATARLGEVVGSGRVELRQCALADLDVPDASVDAALAVDVNLFWTSAAVSELAALRRVLRPGGVLHLVFHTPAPGPRVLPRAGRTLERGGWRVTGVAGHGALAALTAAPPA